MKIRIGVSARHVHLNRQDLDTLFGDGYEFEISKDLTQSGQYASTAEVDLIGPEGEIKGVRILGPCRNETQIEVSKTDGYRLGLNAPLRLSGKIIGSPGVKLIGPKGEVELNEGVIVAKRHIHVNPQQASKFGITNAQHVKVYVEGPRALIFEEVEVRVNDDFDATFHIDTDEANAAGVGDLEEEGKIITGELKFD